MPKAARFPEAPMSTSMPGLRKSARYGQQRSCCWMASGGGCRSCRYADFQQFIHAGGLIQHNRYEQTGVAPSGRSARANDATLFRRGPFRTPGNPKMKKKLLRASGHTRRAVDVTDGPEIHGANGYAGPVPNHFCNVGPMNTGAPPEPHPLSLRGASRCSRRRRISDTGGHSYLSTR